MNGSGREPPWDRLASCSTPRTGWKSRWSRRRQSPRAVPDSTATSWSPTSTCCPPGSCRRSRTASSRPAARSPSRWIEIEGRTYVPAFSSLPRLQAALAQERTYFRMAARDFLELTRGADVLLNPGSDYGKELLASEIESLLDGSIFGPTSRRQKRSLLSSLFRRG
ncbi:MAG TPA: SseB family protein [Thermoanaerobaculia bacterium]|nr:SseB family protein [Thermoanaerobaculia bacterium]